MGKLGVGEAWSAQRNARSEMGCSTWSLVRVVWQWPRRDGIIQGDLRVGFSVVSICGYGERIRVRAMKGRGATDNGTEMARKTARKMARKWHG